MLRVKHKNSIIAATCTYSNKGCLSSCIVSCSCSNRLDLPRQV